MPIFKTLHSNDAQSRKEPCFTHANRVQSFKTTTLPLVIGPANPISPRQSNTYCAQHINPTYNYTMPPIVPITLALLQRGALKTMFVPIPVSRSFTYTLTVPTLPSSLAREAAPAVSGHSGSRGGHHSSSGSSSGSSSEFSTSDEGARLTGIAFGCSAAAVIVGIALCW